MTHKFKIGDRVRVIKIDNNKFYGTAKYKVGDVGTIVRCGFTYTHGNDYLIEFDQLKKTGTRYDWYALENWILPVANILIKCE